LADSFLLMKRTNGCTERTIETYNRWLPKLAAVCPQVTDLGPLSLTTFFSGLRARGMQPITIHQAFRTTRTFCKWLVAMKAIPEYPLTGIVIRKPQTLPQVPTDDEIRAVMKTCPDTLTGRRNRAMVLVMTDTGIRATECRRLLLESVDWSGPSLLVRAGKGMKDRVLSLNPVTVRALKRWIQIHPHPYPQNFLFVYDDGRPLTDRGLLQILHRLSDKAKLPRPRRLHPHLLRHAACCSWIRAGVPLDVCRRLMGHTTLSTVLIYSNLTATDVMQAHRRAGAIEKMGIE